MVSGGGSEGLSNPGFSPEEEENLKNCRRQNNCTLLASFPIKNNTLTNPVNLHLPPRNNKEVQLKEHNKEPLKEHLKECLTLGPPPPRPPRNLPMCPGSHIHNSLGGQEKEGGMTWLRGKRRPLLLLLLLAGLLFLVTTCLPFLVDRLRQSGPSPPPTHLLLRPPPWHQTETKPSSPSLPLARLLPQLSSSPVLGELFISVKTTQRFHYPRLVILMETWASLVREQTWFFTDRSNSSTDRELEQRTQGRLVRTDCPASHHRLSLCCKMEKEFEHFLASHKQWWCHFDDDNYVNVAALLKVIERYDPSQAWYLGKTSTASPLKIVDTNGESKSSFWFATGGAGFCISRTLALRMAPLAVEGGFVEAGNQFWFPDDVTMGYLIEHQLGINLTVIPEFHSHLEPMSLISQKELKNQVSFSYLLEENKTNVVNIGGPFPPSIDPTRFYSLHCHLYGAAFCPS